MMTQPLHRLILPLMLFAFLSGCHRTGIYGIVTNPEGEALPGVSVRLMDDSGLRTMTNALGEYRLSIHEGQHNIQYAKSGYTLLNTELVLEESASAQGILPVEMWNLPPGNSVFFYDNTLYTPTTWLKPKRYYMVENGPSFGTTRDPALRTDSAMPFIVCYRMPRYDARLTRLQLRTAQVPQDETQTFEVWVSSGSIGVPLMPIVSSDHSLLKVALDDPLEPGRYALHWGALDGYTTIDERMYIFEILEKSEILLDGVDPDQDGQDNGKIHIDGDAP